MCSIVSEERLRRLLSAMLDPAEFLSDHGLRALSKRHALEPLEVDVDGVTATLDYEPGESTSGLFGGNSNWRGPVWMPINYLLVETLRVYHRFFGRVVPDRVPDRLGHPDDARRGRRRDRPAARRALPPGRRWLLKNLSGTNSIAYTETDAVALAKALTKIAKDVPAFQFRAGVVEGRVISIAEIQQLANLPSKEELLSKVMFLLNAPAQRIAMALNGLPRNMAVVVSEAIKAQKFGSGGAPSEAVPEPSPAPVQ